MYAYKKFFLIIISALLITALCAAMLASCDSSKGDNTDNTKDNSTAPSSSPTENNDPDDSDGDNTGDDEIGEKPDNTQVVRYTKFDLNESYNDYDAKITFSDSSVKIDGKGAAANDTVVTISAEGTYILTGSCKDGQVIVEVTKEEKVHLVFDKLSLICKTSAPLWIKSCDKTSITLVEGTTSTLQDGDNYTGLNAEGEPNACLFSKDDLTINGTGTLKVYANYNNGIGSKDDLKIISGTINVTAENHGIRGNDSVTIKEGNITIACKNDGIKSTNKTRQDKGYVFIEGGTISIDSGDDSLQAVTSITVTGGKINADAGGSIVNCDGEVNIADGAINK